jgi:excisionase family DNA binding protein
MPGRLDDLLPVPSPSVPLGGAIMTKTHGRLLTVQQVADWLNVRTAYVYRLTYAGRLRAIHVGRHVRIPEAAVLAFIGGSDE